jgi:hypothetical protein
VVTGARYNVGDIAPGEKVSVRVKPLGESHIELTYLDTSASEHKLAVNCYIESGYSGRIAIDVSDGKITHMEDQVRPWG